MPDYSVDFIRIFLHKISELLYEMCSLLRKCNKQLNYMYIRGKVDKSAKVNTKGNCTLF